MSISAQWGNAPWGRTIWAGNTGSSSGTGFLGQGLFTASNVVPVTSSMTGQGIFNTNFVLTALFLGQGIFFETTPFEPEISITFLTPTATIYPSLPPINNAVNFTPWKEGNSGITPAENS